MLRKYPESTYWLTTHCQGDANEPIEHIGHLFAPEAVELTRKIKPAKWKTTKTEAIHFTQNFLWFDVDLYDDEREILIAHGVLDKWIRVDLVADPAQPQKLVSLL